MTRASLTTIAPAALLALLCASPVCARIPNYSQIDMLKALLDKGRDVDARRGPFGTTALMEAAESGESLTVVRLLGVGADPLAEDFRGRDSLDHVLDAGQTGTGTLIAFAMRKAERKPAGGRPPGEGQRISEGEVSAGSGAASADSEAARRLDERFERLMREGRYDEAAEAAGLLLDERKKTLGPSDPLTAQAYDSVGDASYMRGDMAGAEGSYKRAMDIRGRMPAGEGSPAMARSMSNLGRVYQASGDGEKAGEMYGEAARINEAALGPDHPETRSSVERLMELYSSLGRKDKADDLKEEAGGRETSPGSSGGWPSLKKSLRPAVKPFLIVFFGGLAGFLIYRGRLITRLFNLGAGTENKARRAFDAKQVRDRARAEERMHNFGMATKLYEKALRLNPDEHQARFQLARIYQLKLRDPAAAGKHYRVLVKSLPYTSGLHREALRCLGEISDDRRKPSQ